MSKDTLCYIPAADWPKLRAMYRVDWPKHLLSYYTIHNYIRWSEQNVDLDYIKVACLNNDWSDGTHVILHDFHILPGTINVDNERLRILLSLVNWNDNTYVAIYTSIHHTMMTNLLKPLNLRIECLYYGPLLWTSKETASTLEVEVPEGFHLKALSEEHAELIDSLWPLKNPPQTTQFIKEIIKYNHNLGAFTNDGELAAWNLTLVSGISGMQHTLDKYRQKNLSKAINIALLKKLAANDMDMHCLIARDHQISNRLTPMIKGEEVCECYAIRTFPSTTVTSHL